MTTWSHVFALSTNDGFEDLRQGCPIEISATNSKRTTTINGAHVMLRHVMRPLFQSKSQTARRTYNSSTATLIYVHEDFRE